MTETEALQVVRALTEAYRRDPWSKDRIKLWVALLRDLDYPTAMASVVSWVATEKWPPAPAEIRERCLEVTGQGLPDGDEAWEEVRAQITKVGSKRGMLDYRTGEQIFPAWSNVLVGQVADRMGWDELCGSDNDVADRAHFLRMYASARERARRDAVTPDAVRVMVGAGARGELASPVAALAEKLRAE